jgi:hypothetical protein
MRTEPNVTTRNGLKFPFVGARLTVLELHYDEVQTL